MKDEFVKYCDIVILRCKEILRAAREGTWRDTTKAGSGFAESWTRV